LSTLVLSNPLVGFCQQASRVESSEQAALHKRRGDEALSQAEFSRSIAEYHAALALNPQSTATYFNLAIAYYSNGEIREAAAALEQLLERNPHDAEAAYNLGCLYLYQQDTKKARTTFQHAKQCSNGDPTFVPLIDGGLAFLDELHNADLFSRSEILVLLSQEHLAPVPLPL
jgi:Flp pilus assembly protein TadD